jgi:hypothetical protein
MHTSFRRFSDGPSSAGSLWTARFFVDVSSCGVLSPQSDSSDDELALASDVWGFISSKSP